MRRLVLFALLCLTLAGCGSFASMAGLQGRLSDLGYTGVGIHHFSDTKDIDTLTVTASSRYESGDHEEVAEVVWDTYPEQIDRVRVVLDGTEKLYTRAELQAAFGERQVTEQPDEDNTLLVLGLIFGGIVLVLLVGVIILIVVLVRRSRRRQQQPPPGYQPYPPGVYGDGSTPTGPPQPSVPYDGNPYAPPPK